MSEKPYEALSKTVKTEIFFKILVLGDGFVGKTGTTIRFCEGQFQDDYKMTIGVNFGTKKLKYNKDQRTYTLQLWDIAGQERFKAFRTQYYSGSLGAIIIYDVTNKLTFMDLPNWVSEYQENQENKPIIIAGNKVDLPSSGTIDPRSKKPYERQVTFEEGKEYADSIGATFFETSAKLGQNIDNMYVAMIDSINEEKNSKFITINSFDSIESGFDMVEKLIPERNPGKIYDVLIRLKQTIFKTNPYSSVLGNMSQWIMYLPTCVMNEEVINGLSQSIVAWRKYHTTSLEEGQAVSSNVSS